MKKLFAAFLFSTLCSLTFAQGLKFAWISDLHIGASGADTDLSNAIADINSRNDIRFVVVTGDLTEKGTNSELDSVKQMLDSLSVPYYVIPGSHDTKWSESACTKWNELWNDKNFVFDYDSKRFIGINTAICMRGGGGHIFPESYSWLQAIFDTTSSAQEIFLFMHHPLDSTLDNSYKLFNILKEKNIKAVLTGFAESNQVYDFNGIPGASCRALLTSKDSEDRSNKKGKEKQLTAKSWGYTFVEDLQDSLLFYEIDANASPRLWGTINKTNQIQITEADTFQYRLNNNAITRKWQIDLNSGTISSIHVDGERLFAVTLSGMVYCYDINGRLIWQYDTGGTILNAPVRDSDVLALATAEGDLYTINANNGKVVQVLSTGEPLSSQLLKINAVNNGVKTRGVLVGTVNGKMLCYDMYSLELIWENSSASGRIYTKPLLINDRIVYGCMDSYVYCIDAKSGTLNWKWQSGNNFYYAPAVCSPVSDGKNIYISTPSKDIIAIDLLLGKTNWKKNNYNSSESLAISGDKQNLYVKSISDQFYIISAKDGNIVKEINAGFGYDTNPTTITEWDKNIIFGCKNGSIYRINNEFISDELCYLGTSRINNVTQIKDNLFAAYNMDGRIFVFELK